MRATDIVRRRRERARRADTPGPRALRLVATVALVMLLALSLIPLVLVAGGAAGLLSIVRDMPSPTALADLPAQYQPIKATTRLFAWSAPDGEGQSRKILIDEIADPRAGGRSWVRLSELPEPVVGAFLAAMDPQFLSAESPALAAVWQEWRDTGAIRNTHSPILRELIHTHLRDGTATDPGDARHSIQDWILGWQIRRSDSPEQLLEWTINTRYYGHLAFGIEAAARVYFDKSAAGLATGEAAMLAALAEDPSANPFDDPARARVARAEVLAGMTRQASITTSEEASALQSPLITAPPPGSGSVAPEFTRLVRRELESILGPERLLSGDWEVETTLDLALQEQAACVAAIHRAALTGETTSGPPCPAADFLPPLPGEGDASPSSGLAIVVLNSATGEIEALVGDATSHASRPTGTLVRPFIYLTALSQGHTAATLSMDIPTIYLQDGRPYSPRNADDQHLGPLRLREALIANRAVPAVQVLGWVGGDLVLETARALGMEGENSGPSDEASRLLFADEGFPATPLEIARAFTIIGNGGAAAGVVTGDGPPRPATIRQISDEAGEAIYLYEPQTRETLAPELAYLLTDILADTETRCSRASCSETMELPGDRRAAVFSGGSAMDAWTVGYTPDRVLTVRVGGEGEGDVTAAPVWRALMAWSAAATPPRDWPRPASLRSLRVCALSGYLPAEETRCPTVAEWFIPGTEPVATDTMTREVIVNRETGRLATIFTPPHLVERRTFTIYPPEAAAWAEDAGIEHPPAEYDTIGDIPTRKGNAELDIEPWSVIGRQESPWPVIGSAGDEYIYYRLAYFPGLYPEAMQTLVERGETPVKTAKLADWDTTQLANGLYTLVLTAVRQEGTFDEVAIPLTISNQD